MHRYVELLELPTSSLKPCELQRTKADLPLPLGLHISNPNVLLTVENSPETLWQAPPSHPFKIRPSKKMERALEAVMAFGKQFHSIVQTVLSLISKGSVFY